MITKQRFAPGSLLVAAIFMASPALAEMTVNIGGRVQVDATLYDEDVTELGSGTEFRRARLFANGDIDEDWAYKLQLDFADGDLTMKDAWIARALGGGRIYLGQAKVPFSLEELTSSKYITFLERAAVVGAFAPSRRVAVVWLIDGARYHAGVALFGQEADGDNPEDEGLGVGGRLTYTPVRADDTLLHVGVSAAWEEPESTDSDTVRFRARPDSHVTGVRLIDTGTIDMVDSTTKFGLETVYVNGPFSAQAEYLGAMVDRMPGAGGDVDFSGYYGYVSWFVTGESRPYKSGKFQRVTPKGRGAWEVAARFQHMDLTDGPIVGGEQDSITLGVNYYVNKYLRFMFNYSAIDVENGLNGDEDPNVFSLRAAMDFK